MPEDFTSVQRIIYPQIFFNVCILLVIISEIRRAWTTQLMLLGRGPQLCGYQIHDLMILLESLNRALESTQELANNKVIKNVQALPLAKSLWNDIIEQSNSIAVSKECQSLCFENIVKLYMYGCSKFQILPFVVLQPYFWFWKARFSAKECMPSRLVISLFNCPTLKGHFLHLPGFLVVLLFLLFPTFF